MTAPTETVQQFFDNFAKGDIAGAVSTMDPEVDWVPALNLRWSKCQYRGPDGGHDYLESFGTALHEGAATSERYLECGDDIVALGTGSGRARTTGLPFVIPSPSSSTSVTDAS